MDIRLIPQLSCPYCGGGFHVTRESRVEQGRLIYGLIECRCFLFPVVDGILLMSLAKGYGGAEEALQPYVPLQVAAIEHLQRDDINGLLGWIRRHIPMAAELIDGHAGPYLPFAARVNLALDAEVSKHIADFGRYEVLGDGKAPNLPRRILRAVRGSGSSKPSREYELQLLTSYYASRFFAPRVNALAVQLGALPMEGRILSLCCGHGVFENLLSADGRARDVVTVDGQFLNLLITRRYANPNGSYICHDVQFPLPFRSGTFDGVFSSTCLPEIPAQRTFASEAIRVTAETGWTMFDSIWNLEMGVKRVDRWRHYRFCQNFFARLDDYIPFFEECAGNARSVGVDIPGLPDKYLNGSTWTFGAERDAVLKSRDDLEISIIVIQRDRFKGFTSPVRSWLAAKHLGVSPVFECDKSGSQLRLRRRTQFDQLAPNFAPKTFSGYAQTGTLELGQTDTGWLLRQYCDSTLALLPAEFDTLPSRLTALSAA